MGHVRNFVQETLTAFFYYNLRIKDIRHEVIMSFIGSDKDVTSSTMTQRITFTYQLLVKWKEEINKAKKDVKHDPNAKKIAHGKYKSYIKSVKLALEPQKDIKDYLNTWAVDKPIKANQFQATTQDYGALVTKFDKKCRNLVIRALALEDIISPDPTAQTTVTQTVRSKPTIDKPYIYYTKNLDVIYPSKKTPSKTLFIEGNSHHQRLAEYEKNQRLALQALGEVAGTCNFVIATLGFIISSTPLRQISGNKVKADGLEYVSIEIRIPNQLNQKSKWVKDSKTYYDRNDFDSKTYAQVIGQLKRAHEIRYQITGSEGKQELNPQTDYHSEVALYAYLMDDDTVTDIINRLTEAMSKKFNAYQKGYRLYGLVVDIRSTNNMCQNCSPLSYGIIHSNDDPNGFLFKFKQKLYAQGFNKGNKEGKIRMIIRYSAEAHTDQRPAESYALTLESLDDAQIKDIKILFDEDALILHTKEEKKNLITHPTIFFSGNQLAREKERALEGVPDKILSITQITSNEDTQVTQQFSK